MSPPITPGSRTLGQSAGRNLPRLERADVGDEVGDVEGGQLAADLGHAGVQRREHDAGEDLLVRAVDGDGGEAGRHQLERPAGLDVVATDAELARDLGALGRVAVGGGGRGGERRHDGTADGERCQTHATLLSRPTRVGNKA